MAYSPADDPQQIVAVGFAHSVGEPADHFVQLGDAAVGGRAVGPGPLGGVIELRQIDIEEVGLPLPRGDHRRVGDPRARLDAGHRPPVVHQREVAQGVAQRRRKAPSAACSTRATPSRRDCGSGRACRRNRPRSPCCAAGTTRPKSAPARDARASPRFAAARCNRSARSTFRPAVFRANRTRWPRCRVPPAAGRWSWRPARGK